ncbi:unnamed protein product [Soboliphyme baturini]|uniref:Uncharacterized protein n=1 Tax=Soboliphyme baturini TaxID=241478 RepID=A0A183IRW4_9BILA|nr:unnamed protein product [Soboliphyme baturini]
MTTWATNGALSLPRIANFSLGRVGSFKNNKLNVLNSFYLNGKRRSFQPSTLESRYETADAVESPHLVTPRRSNGARRYYIDEASKEATGGDQVGGTKNVKTNEQARAFNRYSFARVLRTLQLPDTVSELAVRKPLDQCNCHRIVEQRPMIDPAAFSVRLNSKAETRRYSLARRIM